MLSSIVILLALLVPAFSLAVEECGFDTNAYSVQLAGGNRVPLLVDRAQFATGVFQSLQRRQHTAYMKYKTSIDRGPRACPEEYGKARHIVRKILRGSGLSHVFEKDDGVQVVILCSKESMDPVARITAGKYILTPVSLLRKSASESSIASVLAHEIAHFTLRHPARLMTQLRGLSPRSPAGRIKLQEIKRRHEIEADLASLQLLVNAGYSPQASIEHMKRVEAAVKLRGGEGSLMSVHQSLGERSRLLARQISKCGYRLF